MRNSLYRVKCDYCGKKYPYKASPMIRNDLWKSISHRYTDLMCKDCMENRLGRKLTVSDLGDFAKYQHDQDFLKFYFHR